MARGQAAVHRIAKNAAVLYAAQGFSALLSLLLVVQIARALGDVALGKYSFALAFVSYAEVFLELGFNTLLVREVARNRDLMHRLMSNLLMIRVFTSVVVFAAILLVLGIIDYPADTETIVVIFSLYVIFASFGGIFRAASRAVEKMEYEGIITAASRVISVLLAVTAIMLGYGLVQIAAAFAIGGLSDLLLGYFICGKRFATPGFAIDLALWKRLFNDAIPIGFMILTTMIFVRTDTLMLSAFKGDAVVGWYNAAYNLVLALKPIPLIFGIAVFPVMSRLFVSSKEALNFTCETSLRYMLVLGLPMAVGITMLARPIILLFYGDQFAPSITALQILGWDVLLFFLYSPLINILVAINRQKEMAVATGSCAVLNVALNFVLIPRFSYIGAGIATIATESLLFGLYLLIVARHLPGLQLHRLAFGPVIASAVMASLLYFLPGLHLALLIPLAALVYLGTVIANKGISAKDMNMLRQVFRPPAPRNRE